MPIYDYECRKHGGFELHRPMSECGRPAPCPDCGALASQVVTAPRLQTMNALTRSAMDRNEKSRHAPHVCGPTCSHRAAKKPQPAGEKPKMVSYKGPRPWVVEHA